MRIEKFKIAFPTKNQGGLNDVVADIFGRAETFTVVDIQSSTIERVDVFKNPASYYKHGAGPIVAKMLLDAGVNIVAAAEFGPGISTLLNQHKVIRINAEAGITISELLNMLYPAFNELSEKTAKMKEQI